jgi:hypothetical protein
VRAAVHETYGAQAVVAALLLARDPDVRARQLGLVETTADRGLDDETRRLLAHVEAVGAEARLPLIDLAIPTLRNLSRSQYRRFRSLLGELIRADGQIDLFEWALHHALVRHLDPHFEEMPSRGVQYYALQRLGPQCATVLSALARVGHQDEEAVRSAFDAGAAQLGVPGLRLLPREAATLAAVGESLDVLATAAMPLKKRIVIACATTVYHDRTITVREGELLRAICDQLECPMPPLLPGQPV